MNGTFVQPQPLTLAELGRIGLLEHQILRNGHIAHQALRVAVLRNVGNAVCNERMGVEDRYAPILQVYLASLRRDNAGDQLRQLGLTIAVHAGDSYDLTAADLQGHIVDTAVLMFLVIVHMVQRRHDLSAGGIHLLVL